MNLPTEDHSPVEEIPAEQTRVYQNHPTQHQHQPTTAPVPTQSTPQTPPDSAATQKTQPNTKVEEKPSRNSPDQNWIEGEHLSPEHRPFTGSGFESNSAIWVNPVTHQPGFLFPVVHTTSQPAVRRQITEEASLSVPVRIYISLFFY